MLRNRPRVIPTSRWIAVSVAIHLVFTHAVHCDEADKGYRGLDWPQFRGVERDGVTRETGWITKWPKKGLTRLWKAKVGIGFSPISVVGDRAYTMGRDGENDVVYCLSTETGKSLWNYSYAALLYGVNHEGGPASAPTVDGERVYTLSRDGKLHCFNAADGEVVWMVNVTDALQIMPHIFGYVSSPLVDGDLLIVDMGLVLAIDKNTCEFAWHSQRYPPSCGSPVPFDLGERALLICFNEFGPTILDRTLGVEILKTRWETSTGVNAVTPVLSDNRFFISSGYQMGGAVYEIPTDLFETVAGESVASGSQVDSASPQQMRELTLVWRNKVMGNHFSTSVLWEGYLYGFDEATFKCVEFDTGEEQWAKEGFGKGSLILADGNLLILSERGVLLLARATPQGFDGLAYDHVLGGRCWTNPVLSHGRIYCRNAKGEIVCLDVRPNQGS